MPRTVVLIVDDEEEFATTLAKRMATRGLEADVAFSGDEALKQVEAKKYDAVLLDLAMPGMDGIETLKGMLNINPDLQIIMLTGAATVSKGVEAVKLGAFEFLEKPVKLEALVDTIAQARDKSDELSELKVDEMIDEILKRRSW